MSKVSVYRDLDALSSAAVNIFTQQCGNAINARGRFCVALAGGSTPLELYRRLASPNVAGRIDWPRVQVFWGDERCVPPDHPDSNYRMAWEALLRRVPIPGENIHRVYGELEPVRGAAAYERDLRETLQTDYNTGFTFDLTLLGMGEDGHTASLFPHTRALEEKGRWAVSNYVEKLTAWRITLTPEAINNSRVVLFLVAGKTKADRLADVLRSPADPFRLPAQLIKPEIGELSWLVDREAAAEI